MGFWNRLTGRDEKAVNPAMAVEQYSMGMSNQDLTRAVRGDMQAMLNAFRSWVYVCAKKNAECAASIPLRLYYLKQSGNGRLNFSTRRVGDATLKDFSQRRSLQRFMAKGVTENLTEVVEHPVLDLIENVNGLQDGFEAMTTTWAHAELTGNAYWWLEYGPLGLPLNYWVLQPPLMKVVTDNRGTIVRYEYRRGTTEVKMQPEEVMHVKYANPHSPLYGMGKVAAAADEVTLLWGMNDYEIALFKNMARPDFMLTVPGEMPKDEQSRTRKAFQKMFGGAKKGGKFVIGTGGADIKFLNFPPRELAFLQGSKRIRDVIAGVFGVPISKLATEDVNRANADAGEAQYRTDTIKPMLCLMEQKMNQTLLPLYKNDRLFLAYDDPVSPDADRKIRERESNLRTGYTSINEERGADGLDPVAWGDAPLQVQAQEASAEAAMAAAERPAPTPARGSAQDEKPKSVACKPIDKGRADRRAAQEEAFRKPHVEKVKAALVPVLEDVKKTLIRNIEKGNRIIATKSAPEALQSWLLGRREFAARFGNAVTPPLKALIGLNGSRVLADLPVTGVTFDVNSPYLTAYLEHHVPRLSERVYGEMTDKLQDAVAVAQNESIAAGETIREQTARIVASVEGEFDNFEGFWAERIATTETAKAQTRSAEEAWKQSGVVLGKEWAAAGDPCDECAELDGKTWGLGDVIEQNDYEDVEGPPLHPMCRCVLLEVLE